MNTTFWVYVVLDGVTVLFRAYSLSVLKCPSSAWDPYMVQGIESMN